jgi:hypothetical protein
MEIRKSTLIVGCILFASVLAPSIASAQGTVITTNDPSGVCTVSCVQTVRYGRSELALVQVKNKNGDIVFAKSVHLPMDAQLASTSSSTANPTSSGNLHTAGTTTVSSSSTTDVYTLRDGTIVVVVTTVTTDSNGNVLDVEVQEYRIPAGTEKK